MTYKERFNRKNLARRVLAACMAIGFVAAPAWAMAESNITGKNDNKSIRYDNLQNTYSIYAQEVSGDVALNKFKTFTLGADDKAIMYFHDNFRNGQWSGEANNLINLVQDQIQINGTLTAVKGSKIGGNMYFLSSNGMVVGSEGVINAGSLTVLTPTKNVMNGYFEKNLADNALAFTSLISDVDTIPLYQNDSVENGNQYTQENTKGLIKLEKGAEINTSGNEYSGNINLRSHSMMLLTGSKISTGLSDKEFEKIVELHDLPHDEKLSEEKGAGGIKLEASEGIYAIDPTSPAGTNANPGVALTTHSGNIEITSSGDINLYGIKDTRVEKGNITVGNITTESGSITITSSGNIVNSTTGNYSSDIGVEEVRHGNITVGDITSTTGAIEITSSGNVDDRLHFVNQVSKNPEISLDRTNYKGEQLNVEKANIKVGNITSGGAVAIKSGRNADDTQSKVLINIQNIFQKKSDDNHNVNIKIDNIDVGDINSGSVEITNKANNETVPKYDIRLSGNQYNTVGVDISNVTTGNISSRNDVNINNAFEDGISLNATKQKTVIIGTTSIGNENNASSISTTAGSVNITTVDSLKTGDIQSQGNVVITNKITNDISLKGRYQANADNNKRVDIKTGAITSQTGHISLGNNGYGNIVTDNISAFGETDGTGYVTINNTTPELGSYDPSEQYYGTDYSKEISTGMITAKGKNTDASTVYISGVGKITPGTITADKGKVKINAQSKDNFTVLGANSNEFIPFNLEGSIALKKENSYISAPEKFDDTNGMSGGQVNIELSSTDSLGSNDNYIKIKQGVVSATVSSDKDVYIEAATPEDETLNIQKANGKNIYLRGKTVNVGELALSTEQNSIRRADSINIEAEKITHYGNTGPNNNVVNYLAAGQVNLTAKNEKGLTVTLNNNPKNINDDFYNKLGTIKINAKGDTTLNYNMGSREKVANVNIINAEESKDVEVNITGGSLNLHSPLSTNGNITLTADKGITVGDLTSNGDIELNTDNAITAGNVQANDGKITLTADKGITTENLTSKGDIELNTDNTIRAGNVQANDGKITLTADNIAAGDLTATGNEKKITVTSTDGNAVLNNVNAATASIKAENGEVKAHTLNAQDLTLDGKKVAVDAMQNVLRLD